MSHQGVDNGGALRPVRIVCRSAAGPREAERFRPSCRGGLGSRADLWLGSCRYRGNYFRSSVASRRCPSRLDQRLQSFQLGDLAGMFLTLFEPLQLPRFPLAIQRGALTGKRFLLLHQILPLPVKLGTRTLAVCRQSVSIRFDLGLKMLDVDSTSLNRSRPTVKLRLGLRQGVFGCMQPILPGLMFIPCRLLRVGPLSKLFCKRFPFALQLFRFTLQLRLPPGYPVGVGLARAGPLLPFISPPDLFQKELLALRGQRSSLLSKRRGFLPDAIGVAGQFRLALGEVRSLDAELIDLAVAIPLPIGAFRLELLELRNELGASIFQKPLPSKQSVGF